MPKSIFDREIFFKLEKINNPFIAARAIAQRTRILNSKQRQQEGDSISATTAALNEYLEGRIHFSNKPKDISPSQ